MIISKEDYTILAYVFMWMVSTVPGKYYNWIEHATAYNLASSKLCLNVETKGWTVGCSVV